MKKLGFLLVLALFLCTCGVADDDGNVDISDTLLPIESISMPSEFVYGQTYLVEYSYYRPSTCHSFVEIYQGINLNVRTLAVRSRVVTGAGECADFQDELENRSFNFTVDNTEMHIFKIYQGTDNNGVDQYMQIEIPVIE